MVRGNCSQLQSIVREGSSVLKLKASHSKTIAEENESNGKIVAMAGNREVGFPKTATREQLARSLSGNDEGSDLVIPSVRLKEKFVGSGQIAAAMYEKKNGSNEISTIWCEWLGKKCSNDEDKVKVLDHDFGAVTFAYDYELGKSGLKRRRSVSEPEDVSRSLTNQYGLCEEESSKTTCASSNLVLDRYDDQLMNTGFISSKTAFHVFHTSCLIQWILYCEFEIVQNQTVSTKGGRRSRKKNGTKSNTTGKDGTMSVLPNPIVSVFCPDCQGTGVNIEGDEFEKPLTPLSEMFKIKIKVSEGHRGWMKNPEILENCSTELGTQVWVAEPFNDFSFSCRIWCEWLGKKCSNDEDKVKVLDHDFGVGTFAYNYELGKIGLFDDMKLLLSSSAAALTENDEGGNRKRWRSVSEPEDVSRSLTNQYGLCEEESSKTTA
ncbi:hypothetical protein SADUNF_Sadunf13G0108300 [Salix dunnii]|uniref:Uncharacterized protein n=1 Tax=Salix dunnii TaxID=1413687 RepID=A0A835JLL8_9ROSI|nr:hypothetical protein SADUNF_Sadunf13G0108300 [Salix dunnii]